MEVHEVGRLSLRGLRDAVLSGDPACLCDPELFTGPSDMETEDEPADERQVRIAVAREVCASCPVRLACLTYALRTRPTAGVWAGFTAEEIAGLNAAAAKRPSRRPAVLREPNRPISGIPEDGAAAAMHIAEVA